MSLDSLVPGLHPAHQRSTFRHLAVSQQVAGSTRVEHSGCFPHDSATSARAQGFPMREGKKVGWVPFWEARLAFMSNG
jgi:hypothetical protein